MAGISTLFRRKKKDEDLDPALAAVHLSFAEMRKKDWRAATVIANDAFGLGLTLAPNPRGKGSIIDSISFGGPAAEERVLREGDLIIKITNTACDEMAHSDVNRLLLECAGDGQVELEVINPDAKDKGDAVSMRGDDEESPARSSRPSGFSNPGLAGPRASSTSSLNLPPAAGTTTPPARAPAAQAAATAGYVDVINMPLNMNVVSEVHKLRPGGAAGFARTLTSEETAAQQEELRKRGYILPDEVASSNVKKATALPTPPPDSGAPSAPPRPETTSPLSGRSPQVSPSHSTHTISPPALAPTHAGSGYATQDSIAGRVPAATTATASAGQYYVGPADSGMAATLLQSKEEGSFVLRESLGSKGKYALTVKFGGTFHQIAISQDAQGYRIGRAHVFPTINALIEYYQSHSLDQHFSALKTTLLHPRGSLDFHG